MREWGREQSIESASSAFVAAVAVMRRRFPGLSDEEVLAVTFEVLEAGLVRAGAWMRSLS